MHGIQKIVAMNNEAYVRERILDTRRLYLDGVLSLDDAVHQIMDVAMVDIGRASQYLAYYE